MGEYMYINLEYKWRWCGELATPLLTVRPVGVYFTPTDLALQWLPFFVLRGTITQQTFGFCQPFLILKT
jgi:hypothetical protein